MEIHPPGPTLHTERLILRPVGPGDFEPLAAMGADERVMKTLGGVQPRSVAWRGFLSLVGGWMVQGFGMFSVIERDSGAWVGRIGPLCPEGWPGTEVGWALVHDAWGKGYAVEAAAAAMDWVVDSLGWSEVIHCIEDSNPASQQVARRLGSKWLRVGHLPPPTDIDIGIWGQSAEQWRAQRTTARP